MREREHSQKPSLSKDRRRRQDRKENGERESQKGGRDREFPVTLSFITSGRSAIEEDSYVRTTQRERRRDRFTQKPEIFSREEKEGRQLRDSVGEK